MEKKFYQQISCSHPFYDSKIILLLCKNKSTNKYVHTPLPPAPVKSLYAMIHCRKCEIQSFMLTFSVQN